MAPTFQLLAFDEGDVVTGCLRESEPLLANVDRLLRNEPSISTKYVVGAIPFAASDPVRLFCPKLVSRTAALGRSRRKPPVEFAAPADGRIRGVRATEDRGFTHLVNDALERIRFGEFDKVVLCRSEQVEFDDSLDVVQVLSRLRRSNPRGFSYCLRLAEQSEYSNRGDYFIGSSPELLLSRRGDRVVSVPLAGTCRRGESDEEDNRRAEGLLKSEKDRREHRFVVEQLVESLRPFARSISWERVPTVAKTRNLLHLSTRVEAYLVDRDVSALRLAVALHPTAAVCGAPRDAAARFISTKEACNRGLFTGAIGYVDARGDGDWVVAIRCAELCGARARLFAGAGIVSGSIPEQELRETDAKMEVMRKALGIEVAS